MYFIRRQLVQVRGVASIWGWIEYVDFVSTIVHSLRITYPARLTFSPDGTHLFPIGDCYSVNLDIQVFNVTCVRLDKPSSWWHC
jgi:hypothetical protein